MARGVCIHTKGLYRGAEFTFYILLGNDGDHDWGEQGVEAPAGPQQEEDHEARQLGEGDDEDPRGLLRSQGAF